MEKHTKWYRPRRERKTLITAGLAAIFGPVPATEQKLWDVNDVVARQIFKRVKKEVVVL